MTSATVGQLLRSWRERRRLSQLDLSLQADVSTRHLSYVETGRSRPTAQMIMKLTEQLDVPLRERNQVLLAGGYAPAYPEHGLDDPELAVVRNALRRVLRGHEPYPALVVDRWWDLVDANSAIGPFVAGCAGHLLEAPVNVLRLSLHPDGMASRIVNLTQWRAHLFEQLHRRSVQTGDDRLTALEAELREYPGGSDEPHTAGILVPLQLSHGEGTLSLFSIEARVATASDVTVEELSIETFYPADSHTEQVLRAQSGSIP